MTDQHLQTLRDLPIEDVAQRLGMEVTRHKALCPFHDDHHASLSFSSRRNSYRCFACGAHGGTIDLAMAILHYDFLHACRWLAGDTVEPLQPIQTHQTHSTQKTHTAHFDPARYAPYFERPWLSPSAKDFLFRQRRLDPRVVRWCRLTSWRDRNGVEWLQIPYYDLQNRLIGIQNRNLHKGSQPRFRFPAGSQCSIYNLPVLNLLRPGEELWITEGASDCWAMLSSGRKAIAIPSATLLKPDDTKILQALNDTLETPFHMAPDRDAPGELLFLHLQRLLPNLTHHHLPPDCKDFSDYYLKYNPHQPP